MRSFRKADVAVIGGSGLETILGELEQIRVETPYGLPPPISIGEIKGKSIAFLPRHGAHHSTPPHKVNYRANIYALFEMRVQRIVAINAVGAINVDIKPSDLVVPHDLIDFTKSRPFTFYDDAPVTHIDMTQPFCPEIRSLLIKSTKKCGMQLRNTAILVCTEGPRFETPAEIELFRHLGCDVVGMTGVPEAVLARELELCYANLCFVSNMAAGHQQRLTAPEVEKVAKEKAPIIQQILRETIEHLPQNRQCPCVNALKNARFRG